MTGRKAYLRQEMRRYLRTIPDAAPDETAELKAWVEQGNDPYSNPSHIADETGWEMPFIQGLRAERDYFEAVQAGLINPPESCDDSDLI